MKFPTLTVGNAAVEELQAWLQGQREAGRDQLENETDQMEIARLQGRAALVNELLAGIDRDRRPLAGVSSRRVAD